jgi:hypothetical protein
MKDTPVPPKDTTGGCGKIRSERFMRVYKIEIGLRPVATDFKDGRDRFARLAHNTRSKAHLQSHIFPSQQNLEQKIKMKNVAKITVLLMAMTAASEASRLGSPSEVSDDSPFLGRRVDLMSCCYCRRHISFVSTIFKSDRRSSYQLTLPH